jgi:hypothetical protein
MNLRMTPRTSCSMLLVVYGRDNFLQLNLQLNLNHVNEAVRYVPCISERGTGKLFSHHYSKFSQWYTRVTYGGLESIYKSQHLYLIYY